MGKGWTYAIPAFLAMALCFIPHGNVSSTDDSSATDASAPVVASAPRTLEQIVKAGTLPRHTARELDCLARTVYFEARSDGLEGQLAVARTVINRTRSDLFPDTICKVVRQPSQFSFVQNGVIPEADLESEAWRKAVAVARLAQKGWPTRAAKALFFHASYVSPDWRRPSIGRIGLHFFYS